MNDGGTGARLLWDAKRTAKEFAVSPRKLWDMTFSDQPGLPYVRCGRLVRYCPDDLRKWIESKRVGGGEASAATGSDAEA